MSARARFLAAALIALAICAVILRGSQWLTGPAWLIGLVSGLAGLWIDRVTVSGSDATTMVGLAGHVLRMMTLVIILTAASWILDSEAVRFVVATLAGYFTFWVEEIWRLHLRGSKV